jgi:hypothetical protein
MNANHGPLFQLLDDNAEAMTVGFASRLAKLCNAEL